MPRFKLRVANADTNDLAQYDRLAAFAKRAGFQALSCGNQAELTQDQMADPLDSWVRFTAQSPGAFKFVETSVINGVLSKAHIDKNAALLAEKSKILARHGLKGFMHLLEPQWLPEAFYARHGELRGPRCDHPGVARSKYYSPCIDRPEILAHYREMFQRLLELAPELLMFSIWGNDSGAGICWCNGLYPGRNGPDYCKDVTMGKRIRRWLDAMLKGGKDAGKRIELVFATYAFGNEASRDILANLPSHTSLVSWMGSFPNEPFAGKWVESFIGDCEKAGRSAYLHVDPTLGYPLGPVTEPPVEYFIYDTLGEAARSGAKYIGVGGLSVDADGKPTAATWAIVSALARPPKNGFDVDRAVAKTAKEIVGAKLAPALSSAWRDVDTAFRLWPNNADTNHHLYSFYSVLGDRWLVRPIVPAPERLTDAEKAYFSKHRHGSRDPRFENSFFISESVMNYKLDELPWPLADYDSMLRYMDRALETLDAALTRAGGAPEAKALKEQRDRVAILRGVWRNQRNVLQCGAIIEWLASPRRAEFWKRAAALKKRFIAGMDDEIVNAREIIALIRGSKVALLNTGEKESSFVYPTNLAELLEKKIALMEAHRKDIDVLFPNVGEDVPDVETYEETDKKLEAEGK